MTCELESKALAEFERCQTVEPQLRPTAWFRSLHYRTLDLGSRYRRVVCKLTPNRAAVPQQPASRGFAYDADGANRRFVVTSLPSHQVIPSQLYTDYYCLRETWRTELRNTNSTCERNRTSAYAFDNNQL